MGVHVGAAVAKDGEDDVTLLCDSEGDNVISVTRSRAWDGYLCGVWDLRWDVCVLLSRVRGMHSHLTRSRSLETRLLELRVVAPSNLGVSLLKEGGQRRHALGVTRRGVGDW
jgi:hypothetical protein